MDRFIFVPSSFDWLSGLDTSGIDQRPLAFITCLHMIPIKKYTWQLWSVRYTKWGGFKCNVFLVVEFKLTINGVFHYFLAAICRFDKNNFICLVTVIDICLLTFIILNDVISLSFSSGFIYLNFNIWYIFLASFLRHSHS